MIYALLLVSLLVLVVIEYGFRKQQKINTRLESNIQRIEAMLGALQSISYGLYSKTNELHECFSSISKSFFQQNQLSHFEIIFNHELFIPHIRGVQIVSPQSIKQHSDLTPRQTEILSQIDTNRRKILADQVHIHQIEQAKGHQNDDAYAYIKLIKYHDIQYGYGIYYTKEPELSTEQHHFIISFTNLIAFILRNIQVNIEIPYIDQIEATDIAW